MSCSSRLWASTVPVLSDDPYATLGVSADATPAEITAARRRLARTLHPDRGGDLAVMQALNAAHDEAIRRSYASPSNEAATPMPTPPAPPPQAPPSAPLRSGQRVQHDSPSFVVDVAPSVAHEALVVVGASIGEVIVSNAPFMLECLLDEPLRCWCRLDLMQEGQATAVGLIVERYDNEPAPDIDAVRDEWVANLNQL